MQERMQYALNYSGTRFLSTEIQNYSKLVNQSVLDSPHKPLALEWKLQYTLKNPLDECTFYVLVLALTTIKAYNQKMSKNATET